MFKNIKKRFSFYFGKQKKYDDSISFGEYYISYFEDTNVENCEYNNKQLVILGDIVSLNRDLECSNAKWLLDNSDEILDLINNEYYFGGKYVIFFRKKDEYYIFGDATCSLPIVYTCDKNLEFSVCSNINELIRDFGFNYDTELMKIRKASDISQAMPYDYTICKEIKQLIPNHYLDVLNAKSVRFANQNAKQVSISAKESAEKTAPLIRKLAKYYSEKYELYCPLTAGKDSRVVLAVLRELNKDIPCYTMKHSFHSENDDDITIPKVVCEHLNSPYELINDKQISKELKAKADEIFGEDNYSINTLTNVNTIKAYVKDAAIVNGDIIGQVGKCSLHRDIPEFLATPRYFRCKLHNFSKGSLVALKEWIKDIENSTEKVNKFDLFSIENRLGRWAAQENLIYNSLGQAYFNLFNSRCIIYSWTAVSRKERKKSLLHIELIRIINEELLILGFGNDINLMIKISKINGIFYYCSSFLKYYIEKLVFNLTKGK